MQSANEVKGKIYIHFKGGVYQILEVAKHSETQENLVIYKSLIDSSVWARPYTEFFGKKGNKLRFKEMKIRPAKK